MSKVRIEKIKKLTTSNLTSSLINEHIINVSNIIYDILELTEEQKQFTDKITKNKYHKLLISANLKSKYIHLNPMYKKGNKRPNIIDGNGSGSGSGDGEGNNNED